MLCEDRKKIVIVKKIFLLLAIELNPKYTKALGRRARAYEMLDQKRDCLEGISFIILIETVCALCVITVFFSQLVFPVLPQ